MSTVNASPTYGLRGETCCENRVDAVGLDEILTIEERSYQVLDQLRETVFAPNKKKSLEVRFSISDAARMVGRSPTAVRDAEKNGRLASPEKDSRNRRRGYSLPEVNAMRRYFGTLPYRDPQNDEVVVLGVQNFKGGVGKSTIAAHLAQYLGLQGYRILVVDCDPQGTTTSLFGLNPDYDLTEEQTLRPFMTAQADSLSPVVRETYFDQVKLVPANLSLYNLEYELAARLPSNAQLLDRLRRGIDSVQADFDVIIIDPPPALGMISLSVTRAANALVVPVRPATIDFGSTTHFFTMLREALDTLKRHGLPAGYKFVRVLGNDMDESKSAHTEISKMMQRVYGRLMLDTLMKDSAEIDNAGATLMTVYELPKPRTSRETHRRCKAYLDAVNQEIELAIRKTWPSQRERLRLAARI